jgi:hypothetical protein
VLLLERGGVRPWEAFEERERWREGFENAEVAVVVGRRTARGADGETYDVKVDGVREAVPFAAAVGILSEEWVHEHVHEASEEAVAGRVASWEWPQQSEQGSVDR